jgi:hypothetical protein
LLLFSCNNKVDLDLIVQEFSELECKAVRLKEKRFALFERLRIIEMDTIKYAKELDSLDIVIEATKSESLKVADSIRVKLDVLFKEKLQNKEDRVAFNKKLGLIIADCSK